ncbi:MAG: FHA domain-containing protein [Deltaproteobacteria bacterium]|nr:FHA domain-containing protein [Deltaproteobacteria bacterium]
MLESTRHERGTRGDPDVPAREVVLAIRLSIGVAGPSYRALPWEGDSLEITVGRSSRADLQLPDDRISGLHLLLRWDESTGLYRVHDEGSLNGTRLNGRRLGPEEQPLALRDRLALGRFLLTVEAFSPPGTPAGRSPALPMPETAAQLGEMLRHQPSGTAALRRWLAAWTMPLRPSLLLDALVLLAGLVALALLVWVAVGH